MIFRNLEDGAGTRRSYEAGWLWGSFLFTMQATGCATAIRTESTCGITQGFHCISGSNPSRRGVASGPRSDEWVRAIDRLNQQIKDWLTDSDPDRRFLEVRELPCQLREQGIGTYEARGLLIRVGRLEVRVEPIARYVAGPHSATGVIHVSRAFGRWI